METINTQNRLIESIICVNQLGSNQYWIGKELPGGVIASIRLSNLVFTGDPYSHYCGFDESGKLLFSLEPSMPLQVEYK